jgi:hypothetical protein
VAVKRETRDIFRYVAPFATWIALQTALPATAWAYAVRTVATALVGVWCLWGCRQRARRPLSQCATGETPVVPVAVGLLIGVLVTILWIAPECSTFYRTWFCWPIGSLPTASPDPSPYEPAVCGWTLTIAKLIGSAFVIAPVEEVFFRSFLYRWLQKRDFLSIPLSRFNLSAFLWMVFLFTLEHDRPLAAAVAAALYGLAAIRFGLASAIVAHVTTNLLLALYVIHQNAWSFW